MKMSLRLMTLCGVSKRVQQKSAAISDKTTDIFVSQMLEQLELTISTFRQHWGAERLHDFLHCDSLPSELVLC
jgi:hypothetical protein